MRKALRYLRIAFSVMCGILCLLLIALWVRSYSGLNSWFRTAPNSALYIELYEGEWKVLKFPLRYTAAQVNTWYPGTFSAEIVQGERQSHEDKGNPQNWAFIGSLAPGHRMSVSYYGTSIAVVPMWAILLAAAIFAAAPWLRWRFSLRELLIATTLVAILLGAIVVSMR